MTFDKHVVLGHNCIIEDHVVLGDYVYIDSNTIIRSGVQIGEYAVVAGNPAKTISDVRKIKNKITGKPAYPWRDHFKRAMPWEESDFSSWYNSLDVGEKKYYGLTI